MPEKLSKISRGSVLVADDNEAHRYIMEKTLSAAGFGVVLAKNGQEVIDLARSEKPAIVLLDIGLPDISGYEVCRILKADDRTREIPVVIHSSTHAGAAQDHARLCGAESFVNFPIEPQHLLTIMQGQMKTRSNESEKLS